MALLFLQLLLTNVLWKKPLTTLLATKIIPLYVARKKKKKSLTEKEKDLNSVFESVEKYLNELMLNPKVVKISVIIKLYKVT